MGLTKRVTLLLLTIWQTDGINQKGHFTITDNMEDHSWFISVVDSNELGPV